MANVKNDDISPGVEWWTLDSSGDITLGQASPSTVGSFTIYVLGNSWSGNLVPKTKPMGAATASISAVSVAYENAATGADVAAGTAITADGKYFVRVDHNEELILTHTAGGTSVAVVATRGKG